MEQPSPTPVDARPWVLSEQSGAVCTLRMNRPEQFNALSNGMLDALEQAITEAGNQTSVRVIVLAGEGKAFCAGHDLREMRADPQEDSYRELFARCSRLMLRIQQLSKPVVARVHGVATAAGCQLVGMCDLAVASSQARFAVSGINLGLFCATPSVALSRNMGRKQALEMLLTGAFIDAQTAMARGLVNRVVPPEDLDAAIAELAASISAKPPVAVAMGKSMFYRQLEMGMEAAYQLAGQTMACNMMDADAQEGVQAFIDKRHPDWNFSGRS